MPQFLPNVLPVQAAFAQDTARLQLDQTNRDLGIKMFLIQQFVERMRAEQARKKAAARAETAQGQQAAFDAGSLLLSAVATKGMGGGSKTSGNSPAPALAAAASKGTNKSISDTFQGSRLSLDDILKLIGPEKRR